MNKKNKRKPIKGNKFNYGGFGGNNIFNTPQISNIQPIQPQLTAIQPNMPTNPQISSMMQQTAAANPIQQASGSGLLGSVGGVGGAVGLAQGAAGLVTQVAGNLSVPEIPKPEVKSSSKGDLLNEINNFEGIKLDKSNTAGSALSGSATGATAGMALGPIGAAVGGIVGGLAGGISSIFGNNKKKKAEKAANKRVLGAFNAQNSFINTNEISNELSTELAYGGVLPITTDVESQLALNGNNLFAYGGDFNNGITSFEGGGTHEENPYGGILQGMGDNGMPNLVEEGEVK